MSYIKGIQTAIDYIEENLCRDISVDSVAAHASYSVYHFHRIFMAVMGCSVKTYIRRRRLTSAAEDLNRTSKRVIDIAYEYGFESQAAFTRAFHQIFGITPGQYRKNRPYLEFLSPIQVAPLFPPHVKTVSLEPRIEWRDSFTVVGVRKSELVIGGAAEREETTKVYIPALWENFLSQIHEIPDRVEPRVTYGIGQPTGGGIHFSYMAGVKVNDMPVSYPKSMVPFQVPAGLYAVFLHDGPAANIPKLGEFIYGLWLPASKYRAHFGVEIEVYNEEWQSANEDHMVMEIWVPIREV